MKQLLLTCIIFFGIIQIGHSQCANPTNPIPTGNAEQQFCEVDRQTVVNLTAAGGDIIWYDAPIGGFSYNSIAILTTGTYYADDNTGGNCSPSRLKVEVTVSGYSPDTFISITECAIDLPIIADLPVAGSNIQWFDAEIGGVLLTQSALLENGRFYWAQQIENGCISSRSSTKVTLLAPDPPIANIPIQTFCEIDMPTIANLEVTLADVTSTVVWYKTEVSNLSLDPTEQLVNGETYWAAQQEENLACESILRTEVTVIINTTIMPSTLSNNQSFCDISNPMLSNIDISGNDIKWFATTTSLVQLVATELLVDGEDYYASKTDETTLCESLERTRIVVRLDQTPLPTTVSGTQSFCEIENATVSDINISGTNIKWYPTETSTAILDTSELLVDSEDYYASQTNVTTGCESLDRLRVTVGINKIPEPTTASGAQSFCEIDGATLSDINISGTNIKWFDSLTSTVALNNTDLLRDGEDYFASQTDATTTCESVVRTVVIISIDETPVPTTPSLTQVFCTTFNATINDINVAGVAIKWYDTATSTAELNTTDPLVSGEDYFASQTDANTLCESIERVQITIIINDTSAPTTSSNTQAFCEIDEPTVSDINITGANILWYDTLIATIAISSADSLVDGEDYYATQTNTGCESLERTRIVVRLDQTPVPTTVSVTQSFCEIENATVNDINISGTNIKWYPTETATAILDTSELLVDGEDYYASQTNITTGCESIDRLRVTVEINKIPEPTTASGAQSFCEINGATISDIDISGTNIKWFDTLTSTLALNNTDLLIDGEDYFASQTDATTTCESVARTVVIISIEETPAPTTTNLTQVFCEIDETTVSDINITGANILWYDTLTSTIALSSADSLVDGEDYYATQTNTGCESILRTQVLITITITEPPATSSQTQEFCGTDQFTINDLNVTGTIVNWYDSVTSIVALDATDLLVDGENYFATQTNTTTNCESLSRTEVTVTLSEIASPTAAELDQFFCESTLPSLVNISIIGTNIRWYESEIATQELDINTLLTDGEDYFATQSNLTDTCESIERLQIKVFFAEVNTPTLELDGEKFCILNGEFTLSDLEARVTTVAGTVVWYDAYPGGNELNLSDLLIHNSSYFVVSKNADGCEGTQGLKVVVNLEDCTDDDLEIYDGFSPNGDAVNEAFNIKNISLLFPNYAIIFYNRWGNVIYEGNANKPSWNGQLKGDGKIMPKGIYFYVLNFNKNDKRPKQGRLYLSR